MSRNVSENIYVTIAFSRDAAAWKDLRHEATNLDISVAHLIKVLLADRALALQGHGKHLWFPRGAQGQSVMASAPQPELVSPSEEGKTSKRSAASAALYWNE